MKLMGYICRRLTYMVLTLVVVLTITFFLMRAVPGDPEDVLIGPNLDPAVKDSLRQRYGLDESLAVQFTRFISNTLQGEFGTSFRYQLPVADVLGDKLVNTLLIMAPAVVLAFTFGILAGAYSGSRIGRWQDTWITRTVLAVRSAPAFWIATLALTLFSYKLGWLPSAGMSDANQGEGLWQQVFSLSYLEHLVLPLTLTTLIICAWPLLTMRTAMLDVLQQDFVHLLEATGMSRFRILFRHAARNAMLPVVSLLPTLAEFLVGGQVVIEQVFSWPGMGREMVDAVNNYDYPILQGAFLLTATVVIVIAALSDILYVYLDPRVRLT